MISTLSKFNSSFVFHRLLLFWVFALSGFFFSLALPLGLQNYFQHAAVHEHDAIIGMIQFFLLKKLNVS